MSCPEYDQFSTVYNVQQLFIFSSASFVPQHAGRIKLGLIPHVSSMSSRYDNDTVFEPSPLWSEYRKVSLHDTNNTARRPVWGVGWLAHIQVETLELTIYSRYGFHLMLCCLVTRPSHQQAALCTAFVRQSVRQSVLPEILGNSPILDLIEFRFGMISVENCTSFW